MTSSRSKKKRQYVLLKILAFGIILVSLNTLWMAEYSSVQQHSQQQRQKRRRKAETSSTSKASICTKESESPSSNSTRFYISPQHDLSDFLQGPGLKKLQLQQNTKKHLENQNHTATTHVNAVCRLQNRFTLHFPHVMQQLYACISWWQAVGEAEVSTTAKNSPDGFSKNSILSVSLEVNNALQTAPANRFTRGILKYLDEVFHVQTQIEEDIEVKLKYYSGIDSEELNNDGEDQNLMAEPILLESMFHLQEEKQSAYNMESPQHMQTFVSGVIETIFPDLVKSQQQNRCRLGTTTQNSAQQQPKIGILNRKDTRTILNVDELIQRIQDEVQLPINTVTAVAKKRQSLNVSVAYFESLSFEAQIEFFASTNIVLSPHGAPLTGVPFMYKKNAYGGCRKNDNGGGDENDINRSSFLLEFLPKRYFVPDYFGSLASLADIDYRYVYLSNYPDPYEELKQIQANTASARNLRRSVRMKNYCLPLDVVVEAVQIIVNAWHKQNQACCDVVANG